MGTRIAFVNGKGGVGKTTCATLFAAVLKNAGYPVSIDDRDPQKSATTAAGIFDIPIGADCLFEVIDTAPNIHDPATIEAIRIADLVVLVTTPSPLDLATTVATGRRIEVERGGRATRVLFNLVQTNNRFFDEMPIIAKEIPFPCFENHLIRRTAYQAAQLQGWRSMPAMYREEVIRVAMEMVTALPKGIVGQSDNRTK